MGENRPLNVPCLGWIFSQSPKREGKMNLNAPIIIWWLEPIRPSFTKRKVFYSFLDEFEAPLRTNVSKGLNRDSRVYENQGFNVHCTNTTRYIYPVPKMRDSNDGRKFPGFNLWKDYSITSRIPSYIADQARLNGQGFEGGEDGVLALAQGSADEQRVYRNIVITTCQYGDPDISFNTDPVCTTKEEPLPLDDPRLTDLAVLLHWKLAVFMQYIVDNTIMNFEAARVGGRIPDYDSAFALLQYILFSERNYAFTEAADGFELVEVLPGAPGAGGAAGRYLAILGLRAPVNPPPWTQTIPVVAAAAAPVAAV